MLSVCAGTGEASAAVQAMRSLPQQQQLVLCVAAKLLGQADQTEAAPPGGRAPGTPTAKSKVGLVTCLWGKPASTLTTASQDSRVQRKQITALLSLSVGNEEEDA